MMKRFLAVAVAVTCAAAAFPAQAQDADKYTRADGIRDRFRVQLGLFSPSHSTFTRLQPADAPDIPGVDLEADTKLDDRTTEFRGQIGFKLGRRHEIRVAYLNMQRSTSTTIDGEIRWGDKTFPINSEIEGFWDTRVTKVDYRFSAIKNDKLDINVGLGLFVMRVRSGMVLSGDGPSDSLQLPEDVRKTAPLPMVGLGVGWNFADRWMLRGSFQLLGISIDDTVDGRWFEALAGVEYNLHRNFGVGAGFVLADIEVKARLTDHALSEFEYEYRFNGPVIFGFANF